MTARHGMAVARLMILASPASVQEQDPASVRPGVVKAVFLDPTTYVPAIVAWEAMSAASASQPPGQERDPKDQQHDP